MDKMNILKGKSAIDAYTLMTYSAVKERDVTTADLKNYINLLKKEHLEEEYNYNLNKYLQRYTHPLICILLAILGCILGFSKPREQRLIGFTIAIVLLASIRSRIREQDLPAPLRGAPIVLISAALMSIAFMGFSGLNV